MTSISHVIVALFTMKYGQFIRSFPHIKETSLTPSLLSGEPKIEDV